MLWNKNAMMGHIFAKLQSLKLNFNFVACKNVFLLNPLLAKIWNKDILNSQHKLIKTLMTDDLTQKPGISLVDHIG
jgi:hypothetical protein